MQEFRADLHIHSRFSRATSTRLNIPLLAAWARVKGLAVLGTGDFTHPQWRAELAQNLRFHEPSGLYALADSAALSAVLPDLGLPGLAAPPDPSLLSAEAAPGQSAPAAPLFMLQGEISSIYKRGGRVRKVHNLVFMPTLEAAERFCQRLDQVGNLNSDGRPILGLDSRDLLEMVLEAHPLAFLAPAHIWTPWFSVFGSKSGFDRIEDCFGDLTGEVFALETGLSSDPAMNRMWSALDNFRLISNSDAHSGENLGREANVFAGAVSYEGIHRALKYPEAASATRFLGTLEFFPEEGKYHMDGHRKCGVLLTPEETRARNGICPVCGGPVTVGVLNRVMELADRAEPEYRGEKSFTSLVPLPEVLGEILGVGPKSRKVTDMYVNAVGRFGSELHILRHAPEDDLARFFPPLGEAVARMRRGEVQLSGGYDGEYGTVRMFTEKERRDIQRGAGIVPRSGGRGRVQGLSLLGDAGPAGQKAGPEAPASEITAPETFLKDGLLPGGALSGKAAPRTKRSPRAKAVPDHGEGDEDFIFSDMEGADAAPGTFAAAPGKEGAAAREEASSAVDGAAAPSSGDSVPVARTDSFPRSAYALNPEQERAVLAGPGPVLVLAGPGTGKTRTLVERVMHLLDEGISARRILAVTFTRRAATEMDTRLGEALGPDVPLPRTDTLHALALELWHRTHSDVPVLLSEESARRVFAEANAETPAPALREAWQALALARERMETPPPDLADMGQRYFMQKQAWNLADYTDLLEFWLERIRGGFYNNPYSHVLVDEVQDLSPLQLVLARSLVSSSGEGFFGIGDPDQSIYGFRGAHGAVRDFFAEVWPGLETISLTHNYRSRPGILAASHALLGENAASPALVASRKESAAVHHFSAPGEDSEALWIAERITRLIGLGSHTLADADAMKTAGKTSPFPGLRMPEHGYSPGDIAVLVRTHALARPLRKALARSGVPVASPAADAFWADERVALIIRAAGRMLGITDTEPGGERDIPECPDKVLAKGPLGVAAYLSIVPPFDTLFWQASPFRSLVRAFDANGGWAGLITWVNLQSELELVRAKAEKVQILTLHAAKGLEFAVVFMPCLEDGLLPFMGADTLTGKYDKGSGPDLDEERRLFYVGMTRARDGLFLSHSARRMLYGKELRLQPSRYLGDLPPNLLTRSTLVAHAARKEKQLTLL